MNKTALISRYAENDDEKIVLSHLLDVAERSRMRDTVESGSFLSESLKMRAEQMLKQAGYLSFIFFGGYEGAERTCAVFYTDYCDGEAIRETPSLADITFVKAELDRFNKDAPITHRDVLGSLMGLGIERDSVGDIIVGNGGAIIAVKSSIAPFAEKSLFSVSRYPVKITLLEKVQIDRKDDFDRRFDTVASLRLDAMVAALFSTSRSVASEAISAGLVAVNGATAKKTDLSLCEGDKVSYRGHGRAELEKTDGLSKKGRVRIIFKKWK